MRKYLLSALLLVASLTAWASPAKPGQWRNITLTDGTIVNAQLQGDEFLKFYEDANGTRYVPDGTSTYKILSDTELNTARQKVSLKRSLSQQKRSFARATSTQPIFQGVKKGIVILVNFTDKKFQSKHNLALYQNILNGDNYTENGFYGSVKDYFKAQSQGQFELDFDIYGICPLANKMSYYGANDPSNGDNDIRPGEMVAEACLWAKQQGANFADYDWDGDGYVDQVFVLYAGLGEADGGSANTIWPHMYALSAGDYGKAIRLDGVVIDTYACSSELDGSKELAGIGTFCHEFSHCMGFPDLYDTVYGAKGWFGMGDFDLMCSGSYNGNGYIPAGYSAYEKAECGWISLNDMTDIEEAQTITSIKPQSEQGEAYIIKNKAHNNEYYIVENRQATGWDSALPGTGVMITHVDYDEDIWLYNVPNTKKGEYLDAWGRRHTNTHPRLTIFHADNSDTWTEVSEKNDLYPYGKNNSLNKSSFPKASVYNTNSDGTYYMHIAINDMAIAQDGTASLSFVPYTNASGIKNIGSQSDSKTIVGYFSLEGLRYNEPQEGVNIVKYADGSTQKMIYNK